MPRRPGRDLLLVPARLRRAVIASRPAARPGSAPTSCSASAATCPPRSTWPPAGRDPDRHPRAERAARTGQPAGGPVQRPRLHLLPRHPAAGRDLHRAAAARRRSPSSTGSASAAAARATFGLPADLPTAAGQRRIPGRGQPQQGRAGSPRRAAGGGVPGAARGGAEEPRPTTDRTVDRPGDRGGLPPLAYVEQMDARVRRRRPDAGPLRGRARCWRPPRSGCRPCSCPTRTATASRPATPSWWSKVGGGLLLADADCTAGVGGRPRSRR